MTRRGAKGFTYPLLLVVLAIVGLSAQGAVILTSYLKRAEKEQELLFRGEAFRRAIKSYYDSGPSGHKTYPSSLEDLELDPRFAHKRHMRRIYSDPISGKPWSLIFGNGGKVIGVASLSQERPIKRAGFRRGLEHFAEAHTYAGWRFEYIAP